MATQFKESREKCYEARDKYFDCLELNTEKAEKCVKFKKDFDKLCSTQWVKHFERKRKYEKFKAEAEANNWELPKNTNPVN